MPLAVKETGEECAFPHLTEEHADLVKTLKVNRQDGGRDDKKRKYGEERVKIGAVKGGRSLAQGKSKVISCPFLPCVKLQGQLLC